MLLLVLKRKSCFFLLVRQAAAFRQSDVISAILPVKRNGSGYRLEGQTNICQFLWYMRVEPHVFPSWGTWCKPDDILNQNRNWRAGPRMAQTGVPFLFFSPRLKAGGCVLREHISPRVLIGAG